MYSIPEEKASRYLPSDFLFDVLGYKGLLLNEQVT